MSKHTPGPWRLVEDRMNGSLQVYGKTLALFECWRRDDVETEIANARLAASAPELLEALEFVIRGVPDTWEGVQKARAAIAKATGGEG